MIAIALCLLDHLIRPEKHRLRDCDADLLGGLEIDYELKLHRLLHWQIGGLGSLRDPVHEICDAPVAPSLISGVGHEPAGLYRFAALVHRR